MKESTLAIPSITLGTAIDGRFKVEAALSELGAGAYLAKDTESGAHAVAFAIGAEETANMKRLAKVEHAHLAKILLVREVPGGALVVAERVAGETLAERLQRIGKKEPVDAVRSCLRLADALSVAHQQGAYHGRVHPPVVVVDPEARAGPVLALGGSPPKDAYYCSPDRGSQGPSEEDDAWAMAALLLKMLTGNDPPSDGFEREAELEQLGIGDPALRAALLQALHSDPTERSEELRPLKRDLARWFVAHAGEEPFSQAPVMSSTPPPLPESKRPAATSLPATNVARRKNRLPVFAVAGLVFGLGAAWAASSLLSEPAPPPEPAKASAPAPAPASAEEIDLGEVDIAGESDTVTGANNKLSSCVASYMPPKTFEKAPDLSWVCSVESPRKGADQLRAAIVTHAPGRQVSTAMKLFSRMGWYDMAAFSVVRAGCCPEAAAPKLRDPSPSCERMDSVLWSVGKQVVDGQDFQPGLTELEKAAICEVKAGKGTSFSKQEPPTGAEKDAFLEYTKQLK